MKPTMHLRSIRNGWSLLTAIWSRSGSPPSEPLGSRHSYPARSTCEESSDELSRTNARRDFVRLHCQGFDGGRCHRPERTRGNAAADGPQAGPASRSRGTAVHARSLPCHSIISLSHWFALPRFGVQVLDQVNSAGRRRATRNWSHITSMTSPSCAAFATASVRLSASTADV